MEIKALEQDMPERKKQVAADKEKVFIGLDQGPIIKTDSNGPSLGAKKDFTIELKRSFFLPRKYCRFSIFFIPPGEFTMGSPISEEGRVANEVPHRVGLKKDIWMMETLVTQELYQTVTGVNPSGFNDDVNNPVEFVSYTDAIKFCKKLSEKTDKSWRLPTEAEWEYACRAGTVTPFSYGNILTSGMANFDGNFPYGEGAKVSVFRERTVPVKTFEPNAWGLYDMHGNLWEWCADWFGDYSTGKVTDPLGPETGKYRVLRGGSWSYHGKNLRSACRVFGSPEYKSRNIGFRAVLMTS